MCAHILLPSFFFPHHRSFAQLFVHQRIAEEVPNLPFFFGWLSIARILKYFILKIKKTAIKIKCFLGEIFNSQN
jgi:hypothetical protein